jgi:hypothetical protein
VLTALFRTRPGDEEGKIPYVPLWETDVDADEVRQIVQVSVGYSPNMDRYEAVRS